MGRCSWESSAYRFPWSHRSGPLPCWVDADDHVEASIEAGVFQDDACVSQNLPPAPLLATRPITRAKSQHNLTEGILGPLKRRGTDSTLKLLWGLSDVYQ